MAEGQPGLKYAGIDIKLSKFFKSTFPEVLFFLLQLPDLGEGRVVHYFFINRPAGLFEFSKIGLNLLPYRNPAFTPIPIPLKGNVLYCSLLNLIAMVQVDISQLTLECNAWREKLRQYKEEF